MQLRCKVAKDEYILIIRDAMGGDCIQRRSRDGLEDNAGGRTFIVDHFTELLKWKEGVRKEFPLRAQDDPPVVHHEAAMGC